MAELTIQWQSESGEKKSVKIPDTKGAALTSAKLGMTSPVAYPVAVAVDNGWVISVPVNGSSGEIKQAGQVVSLTDVAQKAQWEAKDGGGDLDVYRFKMGGDITAAKLRIPGGVLLLQGPDSSTEVTAATSAPASADRKSSPPPRPSKPGEKAAVSAPPPSDPMPERKRQMTFRVILAIVLLLDIAFMFYLGAIDVPDDVYADTTELPERFAKLIVPDEKPVEEESGGGSDEPVQQPEAAEEDPGEDAGGGEEQKESPAPRSAEEKREAVRTKGILAVFASKGREGGALSDVLAGGGVAAGLDQALSDVGGVVVAKRGMDIASQRGGGGGESADIGNLKAGAGRGMGLGDRAQRKVEGGVQTSSFTSQGALSADAIRAVVEKNLRGVKFCYEKQLANNPDLQGKVVVKFTIGTDGSVTRFEIEETTMNNADVEGCILQRVRRWTFPKPEKDAVTVSYPFIFTATG